MMMHLFFTFSWLSLTVISFANGELYCIGNCSNPRNEVYEQLCCDPDNLGDVIRISGGKDSHRYKYISCPSTMPDGCNEPIIADDSYTGCKAVLNSNSMALSGFHDVTLNNGSTARLYCDMKGVNCDGEGGWTRIGYLNMTKPMALCPTGLQRQVYNGIGHPVCARTPNTFCSSTFFSSHGLSYTKICGQVRGYQYGHTQAINIGHNTINDIYVVGVSITRGSPRKHVWTYAAGLHENLYSFSDCPCNTGSIYRDDVHSFVGNDYYCESGPGDTGLQATDPLWDGKQCNGLEASCCTRPNMPWFIREMEESQEDIELRLCGTFYGPPNEEVPIDIVELLIK